jgi:phthalate 4,5-dioxygenase oxygenase subunit
MGAIFDRTKEHLGVSDKAVIAVRRFLLTSAKELQVGKEPPHTVFDPAKNWFPHIDCFAHLVPRDLPWHKKFEFLTQTAHKENPMSYAARKKAAS